MAGSDVAGGTYQTLMSLSPLYKDGVYNAPARNLMRDNNLMRDAFVMQANDNDRHVGSYQTYAGAGGQFIRIGGWRRATSTAWGTFSDDISLFSDASAVPVDVVKKQGTQWQEERESEKANFLGQQIDNHLLYGTNGPATDTVGGVTPTATPEKYTGLAPRLRVPDNGDSTYDPCNPDPATIAQRGVFDAEGSGTDTTSLFFIKWGRSNTAVITPKNDPQYGLRIEDLGIEIERVVDATSHEPTTYRRCYWKEYEWSHGLTIYPGQMGGGSAARLRNIESALSFDNSGLVTTIFRIIREFFLEDTVGLVCYASPRMRTIFDVLMQAKQNIQFTLANPYQLSPDEWAGKVVLRTCRAISIQETAVTAV